MTEVVDAELPDVLANLGGHDLAEFIDVLEQAKQTEGKPTIIFAYTVKGWGLRSPVTRLTIRCCSARLQMEQLRKRLDIGQGEEWAGLRCQFTARPALLRGRRAPLCPCCTTDQLPAANVVPEHLNVAVGDTTSTQETLVVYFIAWPICQNWRRALSPVRPMCRFPPISPVG